MKILHLPNSFLPWSTGGTETYALGLAKAQLKIGIESIFCLHQRNNIPENIGSYTYENFQVEVLPSIPDEENRVSIYTRQYENIPGFKNFLLAQKPGLVHFHDLSGGASLSHLKVVKELKIPAVITYHSPGQSCLQRALRFGNEKICDGKLVVNRCTTCLFMNRKLPRLLGNMVSIVGTNLPVHKNDSFLKRIISIPTTTKIFIDSYYEAINLFDRIHVHAQWVYELFKVNGVHESKLFYARTAVSESQSSKPIESNENLSPISFHSGFSKENPLKVVFVGRCDFVKGVHVLIEAALSLPKDLPIEYYFFGPYWDSGYGENLLDKIKHDDRFHLPVLLDPKTTRERLLLMDLMVVPSLWPETGPLSLLEGLAAGLPIIGSNIGGIPEWITHEKNGLLFEYGNPLDLKEKLKWILASAENYLSLKKNAVQERTINELAKELKSLYVELIIPDKNQP